MSEHYISPSLSHTILLPIFASFFFLSLSLFSFSKVVNTQTEAPSSQTSLAIGILIARKYSHQSSIIDHELHYSNLAEKTVLAHNYGSEQQVSPSVTASWERTGGLTAQKAIITVTKDPANVGTNEIMGISVSEIQVRVLHGRIRGNFHKKMVGLELVVDPVEKATVCSRSGDE